MQSNRKSSLAFGLLLIALGVLFIAYQFVPGLKDALEGLFTWPLIVMAFGAFLIIKNLIEKDGNGLVSAFAILGVGTVFYLQEMNQAWHAWYNWLLVPGFAGVGHLFSYLTGTHNRRSLERGVWLILVSAGLYAIFSPILQVNWMLDQYWPLLLIGAGILLIIKAIRNQ